MKGRVPVDRKERKQGVLLLHGLARTARSMSPLAKFLGHHGYLVVNQGYPSTRAPIEQLAAPAVGEGFAQLASLGAESMHVVTHSMGGILLRSALHKSRPAELGRVVMLSPPNQGSELVDALARFRWFCMIFGPAGCQLNTKREGLPQQLGSVDFSLGIIIGNRPAMGLKYFFPGPNDGKVSVERAQVAGMRDFLVLPCGHSMIMRKKNVQQQILHFLEKERFQRE